MSDTMAQEVFAMITNHHQILLGIDLWVLEGLFKRTNISKTSSVPFDKLFVILQASTLERSITWARHTDVPTWDCHCKIPYYLQNIACKLCTNWAPCKLGLPIAKDFFSVIVQCTIDSIITCNNSSPSSHPPPQKLVLE